MSEAAEDGVDGRVTLEQISQSLAAAPQRSGRRSHESREVRGQRRCDSQPDGSSGQAACAAPGALVGRGNDGYPAPTLGVKVFGDRGADPFVRETDQHVDRRRRQIPGLAHGDSGGEEA
jgi:hypothetical protein